jgi:hypothetical protein
MPFYRPFFTATWRLTMHSAVISSGILFAPFPLGAAVLLLAVFVFFLWVFGRREREQVGSWARQLVPALASTAVLTLVTLVLVLFYEAYFAPYVVLEEAASQAASGTKARQNQVDKQYYSEEVETLKAKDDAEIATLKSYLAATPVYVTIDRMMLLVSRDQNDPLGPLTAILGHTTFPINLTALVTITNSQDHAMTIRSFHWVGETPFCPVAVTDRKLYMMVKDQKLQLLNTDNSLEARLLKEDLIGAHHAVSGWVFFQCKDSPCFGVHQSVVVEDTEGHSFSVAPDVNDLGMYDRINTIAQPPMPPIGRAVTRAHLGQLEAHQCS